MYLVVYYVPEDHLESTKNAMFGAGAGRIGNYDSCAWQCPGSGQFRPLEGSRAFIGSVGAVETVAEFRVEMVCLKERLEASLAALNQAHPYETPAYFVISYGLGGSITPS
jgi:hypothetical protein